MLNVNNQCEQYLKMLKIQYPNESEEDLKEIAEEFSLIADNDQEGASTILPEVCAEIHFLYAYWNADDSISGIRGTA